MSRVTFLNRLRVCLYAQPSDSPTEASVSNHVKELLEEVDK